MSAIISRMMWFFVVAIVLAYASYLVAGSIVHAQASGENLPVVVRDELGAGIHHLSGMVMVATPCDELSVRVEEISRSVYALLFKTWHEPSVECALDPTPRYFRTVLFAPAAGVEFTATLDGAGFPIVVLPTLPERSALE